MNLTTERRGENVLCLRLTGRFDVHSAASVRAAWENTGVWKHLIFDLSAATFMDSTALATLVAALKHTRQQGGGVFIVAPAPAVRTVLELTRTETLFKLVATVEEAQI